MYDKEEADDRFLAELDEDFKDDPDYQTLSRDEKLRIIRVMDKMMDMGMAAVYGEEEPDTPDADVPCGLVINQCKARCCTLIFALTKDEVAQGIVETNPHKPYFIARDEDGLCPHLDRENLQCKVWQNRPLRCRRYDCREFPADIWPEGLPAALTKNR